MTGRPRLLDLYCGAGGAAEGYRRAGFDVVGVDVQPQPRYPFQFVEGDALEALELLAAGREPWSEAPPFDAIHASPVCKGYTVASLKHRMAGREYPDDLWRVRELLASQGRPWVIENVPGAPMRPDYALCGCAFGLEIPGRGQLFRERWFETSWRGFDLRPGHHHHLPPITVAGHGQPSWTRAHGHAPFTVADWRTVMDLPWMRRDELAQAVPPAYTDYIGRQLAAELEGAASLR